MYYSSKPVAAKLIGIVLLLISQQATAVSARKKYTIRRAKQSSRELNSNNNDNNINNNSSGEGDERRRKLTGYCGWKIWNNSGKTCDQVAVDLAADGTLQVSQAKSQILTEGCVCGYGEKSFDEDIYDINAFCGVCQYKDANFACDDRVTFVMKNYAESNPTKDAARLNLMKNGNCIDRNWTPYASNSNNGGGLSGGAIAGIVIAVLALVVASIIGFCLVRDWNKVKRENEQDKQIQEATSDHPKGRVPNNNGLNVIEEGEEGDEDESVASGNNVDVPQSNEMGAGGKEEDDDDDDDDATEIVGNGKSKKSSLEKEGWAVVEE